MFRTAGPVCPHCGELAPFGDERNYWISAHLDNRFHAAWWWVIKHSDGVMKGFLVVYAIIFWLLWR